MNAKQLAREFGMLSVGEVDLLQHCVKLLDPKPIVINIGANVGTSACAILEAVPSAFIFSIDVKPFIEERDNIILCGLDPRRIVRLLGDSGEIGKHFPYQSDLLFIDGGHHDSAVWGDISVWVPKCKDIVLFHDYHHPNYAAKPGVNLDEIVDEAMKDWGKIGEDRYLVAYTRKKKAYPTSDAYFLEVQVEGGSISYEQENG